MVKTDVDWTLFSTRKLLTTAYALTHKIHSEEETQRMDKQYQSTSKKLGTATPGIGRTIFDRAERIKDLRKQRDMIDAEILRRSK